MKRARSTGQPDSRSCSRAGPGRAGAAEAAASRPARPGLSKTRPGRAQPAPTASPSCSAPVSILGSLAAPFQSACAEVAPAAASLTRSTSSIRVVGVAKTLQDSNHPTSLGTVADCFGLRQSIPPHPRKNALHLMTISVKFETLCRGEGRAEARPPLKPRRSLSKTAPNLLQITGGRRQDTAGKANCVTCNFRPSCRPGVKIRPRGIS